MCVCAVYGLPCKAFKCILFPYVVMLLCVCVLCLLMWVNGIVLAGVWGVCGLAGMCLCACGVVCAVGFLFLCE